MGDRWCDFAGNGIGYNQWCPLTFNGTKPTFQSVSAFNLDAAAGTWSVAAGNNYVLNPAYEADRISVASVVGWNSTGSGYGNASGSGHVPGDFHYRHFSASAYSATTRQVVTGLPNGIYNLSVWYKSSGGQSTARIFARNHGGPEKVANINTPQSVWTQVTISNIPVTDGQCEVGLASVTTGTTYYYVISSFNITGESPNSTQASATPVPRQPPVISTVNLVDGQLALGGINGPAQGTYYVLTSTNPALPLINWTPIATNQFSADGHFAITNAVDPEHTERFFMLRLP